MSDSKNLNQLVIQSNATVNEADVLQNAIREKLSNADGDFILNCEGIQSCDVTFLQLIHATRMEMKKKNKKLLIENASQSVQECASVLGFDL